MTVTFNIRISAHPKRSTKEEKKSRAILRGHAQKIFVSIHSQKRRRYNPKKGKYKIFYVLVTEMKNSCFLQ